MAKRPQRLDLTKYAAVGTEFVAAVGLMVGLGVLMDRWLGTTPVFILVGLVIGFTAAMYRLIKVAREIERENQKPPGSEDLP